MKPHAIRFSKLCGICANPLPNKISTSLFFSHYALKGRLVTISVSTVYFISKLILIFCDGTATNLTD